MIGASEIGGLASRIIPDESAICLWWLNVDRSQDEIAFLRANLSPDEAKRAMRFHQAIDRDRFIVRRAVLRIILGSYIKTAPHRVRFSQNRHGKLCLTDDLSLSGIRFNLARSANVALYAVAVGQEVGVDIEIIRENPAWPEIARAFFAPAEFHSIGALPVEEQPAAFYRCWTRKEAYVKALGVGLSLRLDSFAVSVMPENEPFYVEDNLQAGRGCRLIDVSPGVDCAATLALQSRDSTLPKIREFDWRENSFVGL